jgi:myo-inositol-1(or 4)-monophosphatase
VIDSAATSARLAYATSLARDAGQMLLESVSGDIEVESKGFNDVVTRLDRQLEGFIRGQLCARFPDDRFFGEEYGSRGTGTQGRWIVDPIDGTQNFIRGIPNYSISIAYEEPTGELQIGVVFNPCQDELFCAVRDQGAFLNGRPIRVSATELPAEAISIVAPPIQMHAKAKWYFSVMEHLFLHTRDIRDFGSAALNLCYVSCGRADAYFELGLKEYDIAAGLVILKESGGSCCSVYGSDTVCRNGNLLATNATLHSWYQQQLSQFSLN